MKHKTSYCDGGDWKDCGDRIGCVGCPKWKNPKADRRREAAEAWAEDFEQERRRDLLNKVREK